MMKYFQKNIGSRSRNVILVGLAILSNACGGSELWLHLWGNELVDRSRAALVRVELKGGGWQPWERTPTTLSGGGDYAVWGRLHMAPAKVPTRGTLLVRVALVTPTGDTIATSPWDTIQLERSYRYWINVGVADSSGPRDMCGPQFKAYPIRPNGFLDGDSLLLHVTAMPKGAIC